VTRYDAEFFAEQRDGSRRSAGIVLPFVLERVPVKSAVDVGCGVGTWLNRLVELGVEDVLGVDGAYARASGLEIPAERFVEHDLAEPLTLPRRFDLALSVEVAEHLPERVAARFVADLCRLAPVVLFSAAIPGQKGPGHVNEQWPAYWVAHFERQGYRVTDGLRPRLWDDERVDWWYAQNLLLFATPEAIAASPLLTADRAATRADHLSRVNLRRPPKKPRPRRYRIMPGLTKRARHLWRWLRPRDEQADPPA
jgi:SAM-dependent methyltransferase